MPASDNPLRINWEKFDQLTALKGWTTDAERARRLDISHSTLTNLRAGRFGPGRKVIDSIIGNLGAEWYGVIFERGEPAEVA